jgi:DNA-binding winged helix-turn-helix (wHTH) protein/pimeloyl-ACP methyl ester carboxylesterase
MNVASAGPGRRYAFGPFVLDDRERILRLGDELIPLPPKAVETLLVLVERAGQVVLRDELLARVWPDAFVEPNNLAQQVSMVRHALDARGGRTRYIETVSKRGYRFVAPVAVEVSGAREPQRPLPPAPLALPQVRYARSGNVNIAYQVIGSGPIDIVFVMGWVSHLEEFWTEPSFARFLGRLAGVSRLIVFDKRGTGLSDRVLELPTLEQRMDDVRAVMDAVGSTRAALLGVSEGGPMCSLFAATYPERTLALMMIGSYARRMWAPDYPWGPTEAQRQAFHREIEQHWGGPLGLEERAPSRAADPAFREWWARYLRQGASPGAALALTRMNAEVDVREVLPFVRVPTLVLHRSGDRCLRIDEGRYLASRIPAPASWSCPVTTICRLPATKMPCSTRSSNSWPALAAAPVRSAHWPPSSASASRHQRQQLPRSSTWALPRLRRSTAANGPAFAHPPG